LIRAQGAQNNYFSPISPGPPRVVAGALANMVVVINIQFIEKIVDLRVQLYQIFRLSSVPETGR